MDTVLSTVLSQWAFIPKHCVEKSVLYSFAKTSGKREENLSLGKSLSVNGPSYIVWNCIVQEIVNLNRDLWWYKWQAYVWPYTGDILPDTEVYIILALLSFIPDQIHWLMFCLTFKLQRHQSQKRKRRRRKRKWKKRNRIDSSFFLYFSSFKVFRIIKCIFHWKFTKCSITLP